MQLRINVTPFAYAADVDKVLAQQLLVLAVAQLVLFAIATARSVDPTPKLEIAAELTLFVVKLFMRFIGLLLRLHGPITHVLHA